MVLTWLACIHSALPVAAPISANLSVVTTLEAPDARPLLTVPEAAHTALAEVVQARNLVPVVPDEASWRPAFDTHRTTAQRLTLLSDSDPVLLVETSARFSTELQGRWRWTVSVIATLDTADEDPVTEVFEVPVFLDRYQDREAEALAASMSSVSRQVGHLLDRWLAGQER